MRCCYHHRHVSTDYLTASDQHWLFACARVCTRECKSAHGPSRSLALIFVLAINTFCNERGSLDAQANVIVRRGLQMGSLFMFYSSYFQ